MYNKNDGSSKNGVFQASIVKVLSIRDDQCHKCINSRKPDVDYTQHQGIFTRKDFLLLVWAITRYLKKTIQGLTVTSMGKNYN